MKTNIILICEECNSRNYHIKKNKFNSTRIELRKYCPKCNKTTIHKETK
ncbi:MAG: 50S ribosomal protein L33 [Mycoplasmataceae bacterium]|nr:50S ribosomal protein L33 [Mycoplasmataceae bacterium]